MTLLSPGNSRGPVLDLELPESLQRRRVVLVNLTTGKSLTLELPAGWDGDDLSLDWYRRTITDGSGEDRSSLLSATDNELWLDRLALLPGVANDLRVEVTGGTVIATDDFNQGAGNLTGKTTGTGEKTHTVATGSDADDFTIDTANHRAQRAAVSDASVDTGRGVLIGATNYTGCRVDATVGANTLRNGARLALLARCADLSNCVRFEVRCTAFAGETAALEYVLLKRIAGATTNIKVAPELGPTAIAAWPFSAALGLEITPLGNWEIALGGASASGGPDADLAAAGTLKQGKLGIYDAYTSATAATRYFDSLRAFDLVAAGSYVAKATMRWETGYY